MSCFGMASGSSAGWPLSPSPSSTRGRRRVSVKPWRLWWRRCAGVAAVIQSKIHRRAVRWPGGHGGGRRRREAATASTREREGWCHHRSFAPGGAASAAERGRVRVDLEADEEEEERRRRRGLRQRRRRSMAGGWRSGGGGSVVDGDSVGRRRRRMSRRARPWTAPRRTTRESRAPSWSPAPPWT